MSVNILIVVGVLCIYFIPTVTAIQLNRKNVNAISAVNILLGWTGIGWIVALVWALIEDK